MKVELESKVKKQTLKLHIQTCCKKESEKKKKDVGQTTTSNTRRGRRANARMEKEKHR